MCRFMFHCFCQVLTKGIFMYKLGCLLKLSLAASIFTHIFGFIKYFGKAHKYQYNNFPSFPGLPNLY